MATRIGDYSQFGVYSLEDVGRLHARAAAGDAGAQAAFMNLKALDPGAAALARAVVKMALDHDPDEYERKVIKLDTDDFPFMTVNEDILSQYGISQRQAVDYAYPSQVAAGRIKPGKSKSRKKRRTRPAPATRFPSHSAYLRACSRMDLDDA